MISRDHFARAQWRKGSRSGGGGTGGGDCIEVAGILPGVVAVRDSKAPDGPKLMFDRAAFVHMVHEIRAGDHDL
ncbi:DUF397 domain-containing protein [Actinomadura sp. 7K507]|uniref:DUF397 domain-containing protein n=1 Tax=Actinomadura sp. 7K507 TaxID=2530365 RepID=UPI00104C1F06|nr:DUF397 domain-containing protein [Actinomadura sp. 7K507]TDC75210.1 DUF397 domain-containing protein [Actinomadura sp. 7K507]